MWPTPEEEARYRRKRMQFSPGQDIAFMPYRFLEIAEIHGEILIRGGHIYWVPISYRCNTMYSKIYIHMMHTYS